MPISRCGLRKYYPGRVGVNVVFPEFKDSLPESFENYLQAEKFFDNYSSFKFMNWIYLERQSGFRPTLIRLKRLDKTIGMLEWRV